ncbi:prepilin-type N-terminal cleavage/methylation domain-containing protein [Morganella morganii subsp. sibonii]
MQKHMRKDRGISLMEVIIVLFIMALPVSFIHVSWESYRERRYLTETAALFHQYLSSHKLKATYLNETRKIAVIFGEKSRACHQVSAAQCDSDTEAFIPAQGVRIVSGTTDTVQFWGTRHTASAAGFVLENPQGQIKLIISAPGRIRLCTPGRLSGVPSC